MNRYFEVMRRQLNILGEKPVFSYLTILLLQLKVVWGMWYLRDLSAGNTSVYFCDASGWHQQFRGQFMYSPLYTAFYGAFLAFSSDAYVVTIAHRLVIILVLAVLVLALMRRLLSPGMAWLMAAWWVVVPADFNALTEVHMFGLIPPVAALLVIAAKPGHWGRAWAIAALLGTTILVRNEFVVTTACFAVLALGWEIIRWRRREVTLATLGKAYGLPLLIAALAILLFATRTAYDLQTTQDFYRVRRSTFIGQGYAYSYQQRHPEWTGSAMFDYQPLMRRQFGRPTPVFSEALRANPRAMLEHMLWNASLIPNGLQVLLFNATSGTFTPDLVPVNTRSRFALVMSALAVAALAIGGVLLILTRSGSCREGPLWTWIGLLCAVPMFILVSLVMRPRPEYIYIIGLLLRAAVGACLLAIASWTRSFLNRRSPATARSDTRSALHGESMEGTGSSMDILPGYTFPVVAVSLVLLAPMYFYSIPTKRSLMNDYRRLKPYQEAFRRPDAHLVAVGGGTDLCNYLTGSRACEGVPYGALRHQVRAGASWQDVLAQSGASLFYAKEAVLADPTVRDFVDNAGQYGWKVIARTRSDHENWSLLALDAAPASSSRKGE